MIKAIIFDCFGVLVDASLEPFYKKYFNDDPKLIAEATTYDHAASRGEMTFDDFVAQIAKMAKISYEEAAAFVDSNPPNTQLLNFIRDKLKSKYKIGFLSNTSENWLEELFSKDQINLFDAIVLSFETGYAKPEAPIYEIIARKLGVRLEDCLFIDDREGYCEGARAVGMKAIHYENFEDLLVEMKDYIEL